MEGNTNKIGLILLAAGASKRLGAPKQLLVYKGETLLRHSVKIALAARCRPLVVVLGAKAEKLKPEIEEFDVEIVENHGWENGMGSSVKIGLEFLSKIAPGVSGAVLMVCDQPFVSAALIEKLASSFQHSNAPIVASAYGETLGVPALFSRQLFPELLKLDADGGAKKIIYNYRESVVKIAFEQGETDVDTKQDYLNLLEGDA